MSLLKKKVSKNIFDLVSEIAKRSVGISGPQDWLTAAAQSDYDDNYTKLCQNEAGQCLLS